MRFWGVVVAHKTGELGISVKHALDEIKKAQPNRLRSFKMLLQIKTQALQL
jgi:hypothetical protein